MSSGTTLRPGLHVHQENPEELPGDSLSMWPWQEHKHIPGPP